MRQHRRVFCIFGLLFLFFCIDAYAASVVLVKDDLETRLAAQSLMASGATVLTFGNERVVISETPPLFPESQLLAEAITPSELFIVRDRRPIAKRIGYETIFSHSGFKLAVVKDPDQLASLKHVRLRPVTGSEVVIREVKQPKAAAAPDPTVQKVLGKLSATTYKQYMAVLAQNLPSRYTCSSGKVTARDTIKNLFISLGLTTSLGNYTYSCGSSCTYTSAGANVIGIKKGLVRPNDYYLVGGHYDSMNDSGTKSACQMAPGANDNASGTAGIMELARVFSQLKTEASIIFVAFDGEEVGKGMVGSGKYVQSLISSGLKPNLKAFVVLDMVSYYGKHRGVIVEGSGAKTQQSAAIKRLATYALTYTGLTVETTTDYGDSDHEPFLNNGMAGALLIETDWDAYSYYHTSRDLMTYQNFAYGIDILKVAAALLAQEAKVISVP